MIYDNILQTIGNTPIVRLNRMAPEHVEMFVKIESFNPLASVKDRLAYAIVTDAVAKGELKAGDTVIEATSGNTGIALAMVCAAMGMSFVATMAVRPCLVTERKWCGCRAARTASTAMMIVPRVPFLKPTGMDRPLASSR